MSYAYGPRIYYGPITDPADEPEVYCECGRSILGLPGQLLPDEPQVGRPGHRGRPLPMSDHQ